LVVKRNMCYLSLLFQPIAFAPNSKFSSFEVLA
jgi:hypothetical protein